MSGSTEETKDSRRQLNCLVTGGAGFLGRHLVDQLVATGRYHVTVLDVRHSSDTRVQTIVGDLRNLNQVKQACSGVPFSAQPGIAPLVACSQARMLQSPELCKAAALAHPLSHATEGVRYTLQHLSEHLLLLSVPAALDCTASCSCLVLVFTLCCHCQLFSAAASQSAAAQRH